MVNENMSVLVECEDCRSKFQISNTNVKRREYQGKGGSIWLTYYDCQECGRRHYVLIDDVSTNHLLNEVKHGIAKKAVCKRKGQMLSKKQSAKLLRNNSDLDAARKHLMEDYNNTEVWDPEQKRTFTLVFSS